MARKQTTIIDVAREAGVSIATVSNVLNRRKVPLAEDTIAKVEQAAARLGYRRNAVAASLSRRKTSELGMIVPGFSGYYGRFAEAMEAGARAHGYHLSVFSSLNDPDVERHHLDRLLQRRVDGLFCHGNAMSPAMMRQLVGDGTPLVLFNAWGWPSDIAVGTVNLGFADGCFEAVHHLFAKGCRTFVYLQRQMAKEIDRQRLLGYERGIASLQERQVASRVLDTSRSTIDVWLDELVRELDSAAPGPVGVLAFDDRLAFLCQSGLQRLGRMLNESIMLVGINNDFVSEYACPAITTLAIDYEQQAEKAMARMMQALDDQEAPLVEPLCTIPMQLVKRASTETKFTKEENGTHVEKSN